ncbi:MAG: hypothetical protein KAT75_00700 [Dehalococcoidia bacterium]|nr:hypothetical protein [Dehalococcoidia bacterium]
MRTNDEPVFDHYQVGLTKGFDGSPEGRLTASGHLGDGSFFRIDVTIIGPKPKQSKYDLPLTHSEAQHLLEAVSDVVKLLEEETR